MFPTHLLFAALFSIPWCTIRQTFCSANRTKNFIIALSMKLFNGHTAAPSRRCMKSSCSLRLSSFALCSRQQSRFPILFAPLSFPFFPALRHIALHYTKSTRRAPQMENSNTKKQRRSNNIGFHTIRCPAEQKRQEKSFSIIAIRFRRLSSPTRFLSTLMLWRWTRVKKPIVERFFFITTRSKVLHFASLSLRFVVEKGTFVVGEGERWKIRVARAVITSFFIWISMKL